MIIGKRLVRTFRNGREAFDVLFKCETCGNTKWMKEPVARYGDKKYCSRKCIPFEDFRHTEEWKQEMSNRNSGKGNPFYGKHHTEETKDIIRLTADSWNKTKETLSPEEYKIWYDKYCSSLSGENNHFFGKKHSEDSKKQMSETRSQLIADGCIDIKPAHYGLKGDYYSTKMNETFRFDSFIEYLRMKMLDIDETVIAWTKKHHIRIEYNYNGSKNYIPDFLITYQNKIVLEELKGYEADEQKKQAKFAILKEYCAKHNIIPNILSCKDIDKLCKTYFGKRLNILRKMYHKEKPNE